MSEHRPTGGHDQVSSTTKIGWIKSVNQRFGPGVLFAAGSIGTSHLIQSTRAGADYGLELWSIILLAMVLKYPAFLFGAQYASVTGKSLIHRYVEQGSLAIAALMVELALLMFIATGAIALISGGLFNELTGLAVNELLLACTLLTVSAGVVVGGHYHLLERVTKVLVGGLLIFILIAAVLALPELLAKSGSMALSPIIDQSSLSFIVALAGWMPISLGAAAFLSLWVCAKSRDLGRPFSVADSTTDFQLGYLVTLLVAFAFMILGATMLFRTGITMADSATAFSGQLIGLFATSFGSWSYPFFAFAVFAIMWSTLLSILDACPRAFATILRVRAEYQGVENIETSGIFRWLVIFQCVESIVVLVTVMQSFRSFIDFATSVTWLIAPFLAYLNHQAIFSQEVGRSFRPSRAMWWWSVLGIVAMTGFALVYVYLIMFH